MGMSLLQAEVEVVVGVVIEVVRVVVLARLLPLESSSRSSSNIGRNGSTVSRAKGLVHKG
jgi:hypothetical protein